MLEFFDGSLTGVLSLVLTFGLFFFFTYGVITFCYHRWHNHKQRSAYRKWVAWARPTGIQFWKE
ncbi:MULTISPECIES: hypothetical protein [Lactobacillaceae]|uniref:hypothetical protein n=1 Tax=Lactobacillaceae TaxID=33958 RepID=UPI0032DE7264